VFNVGRKVKKITDFYTKKSGKFVVQNKEILDLAEKLGIVEAIPRKTSIQRNRSNIPSSSPIDHYKKSVPVPLLDSLISQMQDRFSDEDRHARHLLYLVPSIIVKNTLELSEVIEGMLFWENDLPFPKSLGNELRRWRIKRCGSQQRRNFQAIFYQHLARVTRMLFQTSIVFCSLRASYQSVVRKLSGPFRS